MPVRELPPSYRVDKSEEFIRQFDELRKIYSRAGQLLEGIDWALARHPHRFTKISSDFYLWVTEIIDNTEVPKVRILYKIFEEEYRIVLLAIEEDV